jgi:hypothetical protein
MSRKKEVLTAKSKPAAMPSRASMATIAEATGIDKNLLRLAKKMGFPGFHANGSVCWKKLRPEFEARCAELQEELKNDPIGLKAELQKRDIRIKDLTIRRMEGNLLDPNDVKQLLVELATATSAVIKKELGELPPRVAGTSEVTAKIEIDRAQAAIFKILKSGETKLTKLSA